MTQVVATTRPLVLADLAPRVLGRDLALVTTGAALTGLAAQVIIPLEPWSPVPFSGQTLAVLLVAAALGPWRAVASMALYLVAGVAGVPWFAAGTSGAHLVTLGYILGFLAAGLCVGHLAQRGADRRPLQTFGAMVTGTALIYVFGVGYLAWATGMPLWTAVEKGMLPFLLTDAVKAALAAGFLPATWRLVEKLRGE
jgi:biotin transport system substrate-specific component